MGEGCDCTELCSMGPTCPGGMLAGLDGAGCWRTPAVPDPTVEALSEAERRMLDEPIYNPNLDMHQRSDLVAEVAERILTARAATPDALRVRLLEWVDDQRQLLPEHRTPAAHAKVELLRDLRALLDDPALAGRATGGEG